MTSPPLYARAVLIGLGLALPTVSLIVLGSVWLWQQGWLLYWSLGATAVAILIYVLELWIIQRSGLQLRSPDVVSDAGQRSVESEVSEGSQAPDRAQMAREAVERLGTEYPLAKLTSSDAFFRLGRETLETVARVMNREAKNPVWQFTVPEALVVIERASRRLQDFVHASVPFGDQLTVGHLITLYRWRSLATVAERSYDAWRVLRMLNPATALAGELRDRVSSRLISSMRAALVRRLVQAYVREIGAAAIELYGEPAVSHSQQPRKAER
ncbi:MAG: hypothetical protein R3D57_02685 [Hyphomicrobiaceae bacterium]